MKIVAALTAATLLATAGVASAAPARQGAVQEIIDQLTTSGGALGIQARINGRDTVRSGVAELGSRKPVPHNGTFRIGSVTKPFVSTVVLQLAGEGKLGLDAPVSRHLPGLVDDRITVRQVLQHTSGLHNYTDSMPLDPAGFPSIRFRTWTPQELLAISTSKPLDFEPGTRWSYSNANYVVAGLLIEKVTGRPYQRAVEQRILKPLRLKDTVLPRNSVEVPGPHAHGYFPDASGKPVDVTRLSPSWGWAAGEMISTTRDLDTFLTALLAGKLLKPAQQEELTKTSAVSPGYGLGLAVASLSCGTKVYGHDGQIHGYGTMMVGTPDGERLELSLTEAADGGTPGDGYRRLLDQVFC
ncbi:serine hydrolase domain-containing protein [Lentzea sp. BCCO 10_0798]|jgi:D-alanyl-D-alanine carboxypeptidase|uniref:Serine hydrolase domain-containing protein n=1 Tax=Lentzea kristufekii TaxID=3095430 RepID=A0ABU4U2F0_9PSEU|nr:serine hydrolase domain-containing protein [Lentzea sp. BCCO 10_0798]MDX8054743.1 serine hydrolase domain-containing protein [Lentzea sp. BCCO 10_0798]